MWANRSYIKWADPSIECFYTTKASRRRDLFELVGIYGLILVVIWTPRPWQWPMWCLAGLSILAVFAYSFEGLRSMGLCTVNLMKSLWAVPVAMTLAIFAVLVAGSLHTLHTPGTLWLTVQHYGGYAIWAGLQQLILQTFFLTRSVRLLRSATAATAITAGLFAVAHLPNPILTVITLFCGLASCWFFLHYKNLWPLAIAHAILGIAIGVTIPASVDHNMRVGIGYLTWVDGKSFPVTSLLPSSRAAGQDF